jgi:hypothetical protein
VAEILDHDRVECLIDARIRVRQVLDAEGVQQRDRRKDDAESECQREPTTRPWVPGHLCSIPRPATDLTPTDL